MYGAVVVATAGFVTGCGDDASSAASDAGTDAGVVAPGDTTTNADDRSITGNVDTQDLTVGLSSDVTQDHLSVGLGTFADAGADAGEPSTSEPSPETSAPTSSAPSSDAPSDGLSTSDAMSAAVVDTTDATDLDATSEGGPEIVSEATWVDLPVTVRLVAFEAAGATFTWTLQSVPLRSEITQGHLEGVNTDTITFLPDVAGRYVLSVEISVGGAVTTVEGFADVEKVDVGFLKLSTGPDGGYVYEPMMVSSDGTAEPFGVGCSFDTWDWDPRDYQNWLEAAYTESRFLGFSYPRVAGDETQVAYRYRRDALDFGVLHVANATSNCDTNRPTDLDLGWYPAISPSANQLARIEGEGSVQVSGFAENPPSALDSSYASAFAWSSDVSIVWVGRGESQDGADDPVIYPMLWQSSTSGGASVVMDCSPSSNEIPVFSVINRVSVVQQGLLILSDSQLWYVPVTLDDGEPYASCDYLVQGKVLIARSVADFEVAPDGETLALIISADGNDLSSALMGIGPANVPFSTQSQAWRSLEIGGGSDHEHTGLHWIAGSKQLVWTDIELSQPSDGSVYPDVLGSMIYKVNADGTHARRLVYNSEDAYLAMVTTGPINLLPRSDVIGSEGF